MGNKKGTKKITYRTADGEGEIKKRKGTREGHMDGNVPYKQTVLSDGEK
jgi:hypothetical protein